MNLTILKVLALLFSTGASPVAPELAEEPNTIFAEVKQGRQILITKDDFVARMSPFDRAARLKTDRQVTESEYLRHVSQQVLAWEPTEKAKVEDVLDQVKQDLAPYPLRFPPNIFLIKTSGQEEGGAAYTRLNAIILPKSFIASPKPRLYKLITHELFHVYSRHNPIVRDRLYAVIGFQPCREIKYPPELRDLKITNPDAPCNRHYLQVAYQDSPLVVAPILYARQRYDTKRWGEFFHYLNFTLMGLEKIDGNFQCKYHNGKPLLLSVNKVKGFHEQVGRNTSYNIHPEEILAENFVILVQKRKHIPSPAIITRMKTILSQPQRKPSAKSSSRP